MFLSWKNTVSYIAHKDIDAFYGGRAPDPSCDYKKSENFPFFRFPWKVNFTNYFIFTITIFFPYIFLFFWSFLN
jgi:hypothetical protein